MASLVAENLVKYDGIEVSKFDTALVMSLLEESNGEEYNDNDEQLNRVIQSLEAEINEKNMTECHDLAMEPELLSDEEDGHQNSLATMDFGWADIDNMGLLVPSSPSEGMNWPNNYMVEFENSVCYYSEIYNVFPSLEEYSFSSLWVET